MKKHLSTWKNIKSEKDENEIIGICKEYSWSENFPWIILVRRWVEKIYAGSLWKNSVLENWQWKIWAGKLEIVGISEKKLVENWLKPYGIL